METEIVVINSSCFFLNHNYTVFEYASNLKKNTDADADTNTNTNTNTDELLLLFFCLKN